MVKLVEVTKAGGAMFDDENDVKVTVNADNINVCKPVSVNSVGETEIIFNDGSKVIVVETQEQLRQLINT